MKLDKILNRFFVAVLAKSFYKKLVSPDHHVEVQQHRSGLPTQHTLTHTHQGKEERRKGKKEKRGKGTRTTPHPAPQYIHSQPRLIPRTTPTPHTKGKREKGKGKGGPLYVVWV